MNSDHQLIIFNDSIELKITTAPFDTVDFKIKMKTDSNYCIKNDVYGSIGPIIEPELFPYFTLFY